MTINYQNHDLITSGDIITTSGIFSSGISINNTIITDFNSSVSGLLPSISGSGYVNTTFNNNSYTISVSGLQPSGNYANATHTHAYTDITNFASGVNNSLTTTLLAGNFINLIYDSNLDTLTIGASGLQPSGNYSVVGHTHTSSDITNFNSAVSGLLPTIANSGDNRILTSTGSSVGINAESNLTFNGSLFSVTGSGVFSSGLSLTNQSVNTIASFDASRNIVSLSTGTYPSLTELSYSKGVTSSIQTQLDNKASSSHSHTSSQITDFNNSVSGLIPVKDVVSGTGILVTSSSGIYTINTNNVPQAASLVTTVFNKTAGTIAKGSVVYVDGGQGDQPTIALAIASGEMTSSKTYGITAENISSMSTGKVIVAGALTGFNTDQYNPTAPTGNVNGITLWLSPTTSGGMTTTKPSAPYHMVSVGTIVRTHQNEGVIEVRIQNGFELEELHNVAISGLSNKQTLAYNSGINLWENTLLNSSYISDFNSSVSGLLPVTNIVAGSNIGVTASGSVFTVAVTGQLGLTTEEVDDRVATLLVAGTGIDLTYNDNSNTLVITSVGSSPSGNYALVGHTHTSSSITDFNSSVSGLLPVTNITGGSNITVSQSGTTYTVAVTGSLGLTTEEVDDRVSSLLVAGTGINLSYNDAGNSFTVSASGLISNATNNRILTSRDNTTTGIDAETNLVFTGTNLGINTTAPSGALHVVGSGLIASVTGTVPNSLFHLYSATSGASIFNVEGTNGSLFSVDDNLSGTLMSVNNSAGLPVFEVFSDDRVIGGRYNQNDFVINSSGNIGIGNSGDNNYKFNISGNVNVSGTINVSGVPLNEVIDDEVASLLVSGSGIGLSYNDSGNTLTISASTNIINSSNIFLWSSFR